ncbi:MAG: Ig-like domain-containing protein [Candidatus Sericytochromatia bacterium]|nr:Ig-like domain-containing protein [Candidatus Sericytochromatia bacterium]
MASDKYFRAVTAIAASVSVAAFVGCTPSSSTPGGLTPVSAPPAITPITPVTTPSNTPGDEPPTEQPTDPPPKSPAPGSDVTPTPTPTPVANASDAAVWAKVSGLVYDDAGSKLDGVTVTTTILGAGTFSSGGTTVTATSALGAYTLNGCPVGSTIQITATKTGYSTRQQTIVPQAAAAGDTALNIVGFGDPVRDPGLVYALSLKPEVISVTPALAATGVAPTTGFTLTFSTPVNTADVESNFAIYVAGPTAGSYALTSPGVSLTNRYDGGKDLGGPGNGVSTVIPTTGAFLYDASSMTAAWSATKKTVTFTFKPGAQLPTDKDSTKVPQYALSFKGGAIRDANGSNGRTDQWFRSSPVQSNRVGYTFTVAPDTTVPKLLTLTATNKADDIAQNNGNPDVMLAKFSEPMALFPGDQGGLPIPRNVSGTGSALLANMFKYYVSPAGTTTRPGSIAFDSTSSATTGYAPFVITAGGEGAWVDGDATHTTVQLVPQSDSPIGAGTAWPADKAATGSTTGSIILQTGVTNLNVGDLLQDSTVNATGTTAVYRIVAIDVANKRLTVEQRGVTAAPGPVNNDVIRYWSTTTNASASNGATEIQLTGRSGLLRGDAVSVVQVDGYKQTVVLTQDPGSSTITFTPALTRSVLNGAVVTYVSPVRTGFTLGNTVWLGANTTMTDPAGNGVDTASSANFKSDIVR